MSKDYKLDILHEDERHMVVNKPAGIGCLHDRRDMGLPCLLELAKDHNPNAVLVHRLDVGTTGLILVAFDKDAMRELSLQFQKRTIKKEYTCFVKGYVPFDDLTHLRPVGPILRKGQTTVRRKGKDAETRFIKQWSKRDYTKLKCFPKTGRTHQIRIHLSDMGLPIIGDLKYGGEYPFLSKIKKNYKAPRKSRSQEEKPLIDRVALHARAVEYLPPGSSQILKLEAPEPKDFRLFEDKLQKFLRA